MGSPLWHFCGIISSKSFRNISQLDFQARILVCLYCKKHILELKLEGVKNEVFEKVLSHASVFTW